MTLSTEKKPIGWLRSHARKFAAAVLIIAATPIALCYFQGYQSIGSVSFYWFESERSLANNTIHFAIAFELTSRHPLPVIIRHPSFTMVAESHFVGTVKAHDEQTDRFGYGQPPFYFLNFSIMVDPGETSLCSQANSLSPENLAHNWTLTMVAVAAAGVFATQISKSVTMPCFWGWMT